MARELKFRGKAERDGHWVYGNTIICDWDIHQIFIRDRHKGYDTTIWEEIRNYSFGQFTGLRDEYGHEVYEGDIIKFDGAPELGCRVVVFYEEAFCIATRKEYDLLCKGEHPYLSDYAHMTCLNEWSNTGLVRVVGNIYDNPELLED